MYVIDQQSEITAEIPVEIVGKSPAEDLGLGFVVHTLDTVSIRCLPANLPAQFEVDITQLAQVGDGITVGDLAVTFAEGVELDSKMDPTATIVSVVGAQKQEVEETVAVSEEGAEGAGEEEETADSEDEE
jgi:large subunit ribosomal protein L25